MSVRHVSVGRQSIAVHDNGGEGIPLFLMTGFIGTASFWDPFVNALPSGCRVIRYDQRGCGASGAYDEPLEMEQLANDALAVISQLNLPKVHVIGHSMGACAAWIMAAKNPAVLRSSYLLAGWHHADVWMHRVFDARLTAYAHAGPLKYVEATTLAMNPPLVVNGNVDTFSKAEAVLASNLPPLNELQDRTNAVMSFKAERWHPDPTIPMRIACAVDDWMTPIALSEELHSILPSASFKRFETGGHYLPRTFPNELADDVTKWTAKVSTF